MLYSEKVMDHFRNPRNVGEIENADGIGEVGNAKCGDIMKVYLKVENDIIVDGIDEIKVNVAACCKPIPGDRVIGYITKGNGITVHRINCPNLDAMEERTIEVKWNSNTNKKYLSYLFVYSNNLTLS